MKWLFNKRSYTNDEELINAYKESGDTAMIGALFEKHVQTVYGACLFYFKDSATAQDAVMQIFEKLMKELRKKDIINFKGWLSFVVRNHCISMLRQSKKTIGFKEGFYGFEYELPKEDEEQYMSTISNEHLMEKMPQFISRLNPKQKECIHLFFLENKSYQEITSITGYVLSEVKSYIQNGKRNLKQIILSEKSNDTL